MTSVEASVEKLTASLARLEGALDSLMDRAVDPESMRQAVEALTRDRAALAEELDGALAREQELQALADEASDALGAAISEVRAALASQED
ncbi:MAG: DUF4164 family protein [Pseudomonadota bacterium]